MAPQVAALDPLGEIDLLLSRQQTDLADAVQEQLQTVRRRLRLEIQRSLAAGALLGRTLDVQTRGSGWVDLLDQLDSIALEEAVQLLDVGFLKAEISDRGHDLSVREHADLQPAGDQTLDLFKLLKIRH